MSRTTERDQRLDDAFSGKRELRLITHVVNTTDKFNDGFIRKTYTRLWARTSSSERAEQNGEAVDVEGVKSKIAEGARSFDITDLNDFNKQVIKLAPEMEFDDPRGGILDWAKTFYFESRGTDLCTLGGTILSSSFKKQSKKWASMAKSCLGRVIVAIHHFMLSALEAASEALRSKAQSEKITAGFRIAEGKLVVELNSTKDATRNMSNAEYTEEEIHDILHAYYKVAMKRFLDNAYLQAVDLHLLTGPKTPSPHPPRNG
ncbi:uncharacterized protein DNG_08217 [Cephalotrichum gorgonifer]|uniref:GED domain-containing protein n=1 Tax=Cephalotrichum gorgonifer TaxID=2041049 RepID=A0AAE8N641_9PEZI|nr:uncharacterized protein DNG_08217 [Cephalotrichum gorgonifer]